MTHSFLLIGALALGASACQTQRSAETSAATSERPSVNTELLGTRWRLVEVQGQAVAAPAAGAAKAYIELTTEGRVQGNGSCNTIGGTYERPTEGRISFSKMFSTRKMCAGGMETEAQLLKALETADSYIISGNQLQLVRARMAPLARFEASPR